MKKAIIDFELEFARSMMQLDYYVVNWRICYLKMCSTFCLKIQNQQTDSQGMNVARQTKKRQQLVEIRRKSPLHGRGTAYH